MDKILVISFFVFGGALIAGGLFTVGEYKMASILNQQTRLISKIKSVSREMMFFKSSLQFSSLSYM